MNNREVIDDIRHALDDIESKGITQIDIRNLRNYLDHVEKTIKHIDISSDGAPHQTTYNLEVWKAQLVYNTASSTEMFKAVIEAGQTALKSATVINGGAAAALLAFAGNAITKGAMIPGDTLLTQVGKAMFLFTSGMGCAGLATGFRYLSQYGYAYAARSKKILLAGAISNIVSILLGLLAFMGFAVGSFQAYRAITTPVPHVHVALSQTAPPTNEERRIGDGAAPSGTTTAP
ncbi:hypothetical protein ACS0ZG_25480 [Burkholderia gladioli]|uniref:hypothetical protein n=1 Tax=Burkholderia gladioli TaxID=28095 RepID=UPI003F7A2D4F